MQLTDEEFLGTPAWKTFVQTWKIPEIVDPELLLDETGAYLRFRNFFKNFD
jgi:hypothetical protein